MATIAGDASLNEEVVYAGRPVPSAPERPAHLLRVPAARCSVSLEGDYGPRALPAELAVTDAGLLRVTLMASPTNPEVWDLAFVPTIEVERLEPARLLIRGLAGRAEEMQLQFSDGAEASEAASVLLAQLAASCRSLFLPLLSRVPRPLARPLRPQFGHRTAAAHAVHALRPLSLYALRFIELWVGGFSAELRVYADEACAETTAVIALTRCTTVAYSIGACCILLKERSVHPLAFASPPEAELWAGMLRYAISEFPFPPRTPEAEVRFSKSLSSRSKLAEAAAGISPGRPPRPAVPGAAAPSRPLLARASPSELLALAATGSVASRGPASASLGAGEGFDIAACLAAQQECPGLPAPSDTCHIAAGLDGSVDSPHSVATTLGWTGAF